MFSVATLLLAPAAESTQATSVTLAHPHVISVSPTNAYGSAITMASVSAELAIPNGGVNGATLSSSTVYLVCKSNGQRVPAHVKTSGGGDVIVLTPVSPLVVGRSYTFVITAGVQDVKGISFTPFQSWFKVSTAMASELPAVQFKQSPQSTSNGHLFFGLTMGPDHRLYASTDKGELLRFPVAADGTLGTPTVIKTIANANNGPRFVLGLAFDPSSTADNPILWVTHSAVSALELGGSAGADWTGKVSRLSGKNLGTYRDAVIHLPRSVRDHITDQCIFGPDGALYFCQPSQSSMGRADVIWGNRAEHLLSAAILRLDVKKLGTTKLDARTRDGGGTYDPFAAGAPLTIYARGVRNTFDLAWHSNGQLYAPGNGSAAGGNTPAGGGAPALTNVGHPETDYLFRIQKGGYYGHPNPRLGSYVLNGGNPTSNKDPYEVVEYPVGTQPDPNWKQAAFDMGQHQSPDGVIEYHGNAFGGALEGKLLICRYSGGDDIVAVGLNAAGGVARQYCYMSGMTGLNNPVDLVEDLRSGSIYVSELGAKRITLLRPVSTATPALMLADDEGASPDAAEGMSTTPSVQPRTATPAARLTVATPAPSPAVRRTRSNEQLVRRIERLCQHFGAETPALDGLQRGELKLIRRSIRKSIVATRNAHQPISGFAEIPDTVFGYHTITS